MAFLSFGVTVRGLVHVDISPDVQSVLHGLGAVAYCLQTGFFPFILRSCCVCSGA